MEEGSLVLLHDASADLEEMASITELPFDSKKVIDARETSRFPFSR